MIKSSSDNTISTPERGWFANENGELEIEYFFGSPYPELIADMTCDDDDNSDSDEEFKRSNDDEEESDGDSSDDDDWNPNK